MKAAVFHGKGDLRIEEIPIKKPSGNEVVVNIAYCGICGTDLHIFHGDEGSAKTMPPCVLGHEMSGIVTQIGDEVKCLKPGDRVTIDPNTYCGKCYYCRSGKEHFCSGMIGVGTTVDGGFAEYCTVEDHMLIKLPDGMPLEEAAFAEPVACCLHGMDLTQVEMGERVLVLGGGAIGNVMMQLAKNAGASHVTMIEPDETKRILARQLGADRCFASFDEYRSNVNPEPDRVDKVIECVGKAETILNAIEAASKGATIMIFGLTPPRTEIPIQPFEMFKKELCIKTSFVNPHTQSRAVELIATGRVKVKELIALKAPLEMLPEILGDRKYRSLTKIMIQI